MTKERNALDKCNKATVQCLWQVLYFYAINSNCLDSYKTVNSIGLPTLLEHAQNGSNYKVARVSLSNFRGNILDEKNTYLEHRYCASISSTLGSY